MTGTTSLVLSVAVPVIGLVAAVCARLLLGPWRRARLSWSASTLCGIVGAILGSGLVAAITGHAARQTPVALIFGALGGTVVVLGAADVLAQRRARPQPTARELIAAGEGERIEFKSSARYNRHTGDRDARLELVIASSVAAFFNARGGTLLIGVADDTTVLGLANDYRLMKEPDRDRYELWLRDLLDATLGGPAAAAVSVQFERVGAEEVCLVRVPPSDRPVYLRPPKQRRSEFVVRVGNSSRQLEAHELVEYAVTRWSPRSLGGRSIMRRAARPIATGPAADAHDVSPTEAP
jgi:uncharacterized membrane protein YeaQ/YmgE (transglycosylase-associated protein family)